MDTCPFPKLVMSCIFCILPLCNVLFTYCAIATRGVCIALAFCEVLSCEMAMCLCEMLMCCRFVDYPVLRSSSVVYFLHFHHWCSAYSGTRFMVSSLITLVTIAVATAQPPFTVIVRLFIMTVLWFRSSLHENLKSHNISEYLFQAVRFH